ncbi:hypothetical protein ACJZ2D_017116 [Fusarium nematophilum]
MGKGRPVRKLSILKFSSSPVHIFGPLNIIVPIKLKVLFSPFFWPSTALALSEDDTGSNIATQASGSTSTGHRSKSRSDKSNKRIASRDGSREEGDGEKSSDGSGGPGHPGSSSNQDKKRKESGKRYACPYYLALQTVTTMDTKFGSCRRPGYLRSRRLRRLENMMRALPFRRNGKLKLPTRKELAAIRRAGQRLFANSENRANNAQAENTNRNSEITAPLADDMAEDETPRASTASPDQRASKRRAQPHNDPDNNGDGHNSAMDIDSITAGPDLNNPFDLLSPQPSTSQRPRRSATKTNYNYDSQFQYLEDEQLSDGN